MNFCKNGECSKCGNCCTPFLPMSKNEVKKIELFLNKNPDIIKEAITNNPIKNNTVSITCCFYKNNSCMIYPVRPWICREFKCNQSEEEIQRNKNIATNKAFYNTLRPESINDFRNIFFGDATLVVAGIIQMTGIKDKDKLNDIFMKLKRYDLVKYLKKD